MAEHFADRLLAAIEAKRAPVCVGIDPMYDRLPDELRGSGADGVAQTEILGAFCYEVIQAVAPIVPAVKVQSAYFEAYGWVGVDLYFKVVQFARKLGLMVIGDVKRGDIGSTAEAYAAGHLGYFDAPDAVTVNGYFGRDGLQPFINAARDGGQGIFALVRTSNPSGADVQDFADASGKKLYEHMAEQVAAVGGDDTVGERGFSCVGAVVGATWPEQAAELRAMMPRQLFLVPGYGTQGATAKDCAASFNSDGVGAIVNASRSVIYAFANDQYAAVPWRDAIAQAARTFADDIASAVGL
ncbi:MAG: orotidine-5'-phosphate decarboxylase [Planctomycetota bacterium]|jgi:orotidine-5'-phosphate decarboxylase